MNSQEFVYKALWTVVREERRNPFNYRDADRKFERATGFKISDFFEFREKEMEQFIKMKR